MQVEEQDSFSCSCLFLFSHSTFSETLDKNVFHSLENRINYQLDIKNITDSEILKSRLIDSSILNYDFKDNKFIFNINNFNLIYKFKNLFRSFLIRLFYNKYLIYLKLILSKK